MQGLRNALSFLRAAANEAIGEGALYRAWLAILMGGCVVGAMGYRTQLIDGLYATDMTDAVCWGAYIANFTFLVGVADTLVMVLVPAYAFRMRSFRRVVFVGEALALSAVLAALLFVTVDIGRVDRAWHLVPVVGSLNFPASILSWDVVALGGYFVINAVLIGVALHAQYHHRAKSRAYVPLVFVSVAWAVSIHVVTAFLYTWLGARPFWNSAIVAPRFIASAFVSAPAILILSLRALHRGLPLEIDAEVFETLRRVVTIMLLVNLFLFAAEVFTELFGGSLHAAGMRYLLLGTEGHHTLRNWVWLAIALDVGATMLLLLPTRARPHVLEIACAMAIVGVWIEKGMALIVPGFVPTPLGEIVEYAPSWVELAVCLGVWSFGALVFTVLVRVAARVESGVLRAPDAPAAMPRESLP